jgi:hypothetical protein
LQNDDVAERAANWLVLADALTAAGSQADARDAATQAHEIAESKGHVLLSTRARSMLTTSTDRGFAPKPTATPHAQPTTQGNR